MVNDTNIKPVRNTNIRPKANLSSASLAAGIRPLESYPDWYGIPGIKYIFRNACSSTLLVYKGKEFCKDYVEDTMWQRFTTDDDDNEILERDKDFEGFKKYMQENTEEVYELCDAIIEYSEEEWYEQDYS